MLTLGSELIAKQFTRDMIFRFLGSSPHSVCQRNLKAEVSLSENGHTTKEKFKNASTYSHLLD